MGVSIINLLVPASLGSVCLWAGYSYLPPAVGFMCLATQSRPTLAILRTVAHQAPLSMGFFRQEYRNGLPFPPPGDLPRPGIEAETSGSPALQVDCLPAKPSGRASLVSQVVKNLPAMQETWVQSLCWEDPLEKGMASHSSILA